jgi:uncharacterized protein (TIGR02118 family)
MHRVLVLYPPPDDAQAFHSYYEETHLPLAAELPGQRSLRYTFDVTAVDGTAPYFAVAEAEFDDAESLGAAFTSQAGQRVLADIPNYATGGAIVLTYPTQEAQLRPRTDAPGPPVAAPATSDVEPLGRHTTQDRE